LLATNEKPAGAGSRPTGFGSEYSSVETFRSAEILSAGRERNGLRAPPSPAGRRG